MRTLSSLPGSALLVSLLVAFATPLASCAVEPAPAVETSAVSLHEVDASGAPQAEVVARAPGSLMAETLALSGFAATQLPWLEGSTLVLDDDGEGETVDPLAFRIEGGNGSAPMLDFSGLAKAGFHFGYSRGDYFRRPTYATTSRGDLFYFEGYERGNHGRYALVHAEPGREARVFDVVDDAYAMFPNTVLVRDTNDVFIGASVVEKDTFGPDFPGCPSTILASQNGTYLAHYDGHGLTRLAFPGAGALDSMSLMADGRLRITTRSPEGDAYPPTQEMRDTWIGEPSGAFVRVSHELHSVDQGQ
jgi:hypothetical protein